MSLTATRRQKELGIRIARIGLGRGEQFGRVVALMLLAGLLAAIGPARRGMLTQPMNTLRND